jgi:hypothetical protein
VRLLFFITQTNIFKNVTFKSSVLKIPILNMNIKEEDVTKWNYKYYIHGVTLSPFLA